MARGTWEEEGREAYRKQNVRLEPIRIPPPRPHGNPKATNEDWRKWYEWENEQRAREEKARQEEEKARQEWERAREKELIEGARREWERARREAERAKLAEPTEKWFEELIYYIFLGLWYRGGKGQGAAERAMGVQSAPNIESVKVRYGHSISVIFETGEKFEISVKQANDSGGTVSNFKGGGQSDGQYV